MNQLCFQMVVPRQSEGKEKFAKSETTSGARAAQMAAGTYGNNSPESKQVKVNGESGSDAPEMQTERQE